MKDEKKTNRCSKVIWFVAGGALTITGFIIIPPLIKKYGNKVYKKSLMNDKFDFDDMGPEIVPYSENTKPEE